MDWKKTKIAGAGALLAGVAFFAVMEIQAHRECPGLAGVWEGTRSNYRLALKITRADGTYEATLEDIDVGIDIPASHFEAGRRAIRFRVAGTMQRFAASIDPSMTQMSARWLNAGDDTPFTLKHTDKPDEIEPLAETDYAPRPGSDFQGCWKGIIQAGARTVFTFCFSLRPPPGKTRPPTVTTRE